MQNIHKISFYFISTVVLALGGCSSSQQVVVNSVQPISSPLTTPAIDLAQEMQYMGQYYRQFNAAKSVEEAMVALDEFAQMTERASLVYPEKIMGNDKEKLAYLQDFDRMKLVITQTKQLLENDQLEKAQQHAQQLNVIKEEAHKRYR